MPRPHRVPRQALSRARLVLLWMAAVFLAAPLSQARAAGTLSKTLSLAGFSIKVTKYADESAASAAGEGVLVLPFAGLPQNLAEIPLSFTGWAIDIKGQVTRGQVTVEPRDWRWSAPPGLELRISRLVLDAAANRCSMDASLTLTGVLAFRGLRGVRLTRDGVIENLPAFDFAGLHFEAAQAVIDTSTAAPAGRTAWVGVLFPSVGITVPGQQGVRFAGTNLGFGVQNNALSVLGSASLQGGNQVVLTDVAGTGVDVTLRNPTLAYDNGWSGTADITAVLPPLCESRQIQVAGAKVAITPQGKMECTASNVSVAPPLDLDVGAFVVSRIDRLGLDLSGALALPGLNVPNVPNGGAWKGIVLQSGQIELPLPVPQEGDIVNLAFSFSNLGIGLENGDLKLAGSVRLGWSPTNGVGKSFTVADWDGLQVTISGGSLDVTLGDTIRITGSLSGRVTLPALFDSRPIDFQNAAWNEGGLYVEVDAPRGGLNIPVKGPAPAGTSLTIAEPQGGRRSAIIDLSDARSPQVGPEHVKQARWKGVYLNNAALAMGVGEFGNLNFAVRDAYLDRYGMTGSLEAQLTQNGVNGISFPVRLEQARVEMKRSKLVAGSAFCGALFIYDKPVAFRLAVNDNGAWEGGLDFQRPISFDMGFVQLDFTGGGIDANRNLKVSGLAYPKFEGESNPIAFHDLVIEWPLRIPRLEWTLPHPVGFELYGFQAKAVALSIETDAARSESSALRTSIVARLVLPEMEGISVTVEIPGLTVEVPYGGMASIAGVGQVRTLGTPRLVWSGEGALVAVSVVDVLDARGGIRYRDQGGRKEFAGNLGLTWMGQQMQGGTVAFTLGHDQEGDFWQLQIDTPADVPIGPALKLTQIKAAAAWGMKPASLDPPAVGDAGPRGAPQMLRDADATFFGSGYARLGNAGDAFDGWFGMSLGLPGPYIAFAGSPKIVLVHMGDMFMSWNPDQKEFRAVGSMDQLENALKFLPGGFKAKVADFDLLAGANRWHFKMGWPDKEMPSVEDLNMIIGPPTSIPNAIGWGFALEGQRDPAKFGIGAALAAAVYAEGEWSIFYAKGWVAVGGKLYLVLEPAGDYPLYGNASVWAEIGVKGGVEVFGDRYDVIRANASAVIGLRTPGPRPDYTAKWRASGRVRLSYHIDLWVYSDSGSTSWAFTEDF